MPRNRLMLTLLRFDAANYDNADDCQLNSSDNSGNSNNNRHRNPTTSKSETMKRLGITNKKTQAHREKSTIATMTATTITTTTTEPTMPLEPRPQRPSPVSNSN